MNLTQFRASRVFYPDLAKSPVPDGYVYENLTTGQAGYVYAGDLVIECDAKQERFCCTIGNESRATSSESREDTLDSLEEWLFEYGISEGLLVRSTVHADTHFNAPNHVIITGSVP